MGFLISWVGFKGLKKPFVLAQLHLRDTGVVTDTSESPRSIAEISTGWTILLANDVDFAAAEHLAQFSSAGTVIGCQIDESNMVSGAAAFSYGKMHWSVWHDGSQRNVYNLATQGELPANFSILRDTAMMRQRSGVSAQAPTGGWTIQSEAQQAYISSLMKNYRPRGGPSEHDQPTIMPIDPTQMAVDYIFDIPVALAAAETGYRHDQARFSWGTPRFTVVTQQGSR